MTVQKEITDKLNDALPIEHLEVINESGKHNVPPGAESHFKVVVVSSAGCSTEFLQIRFPRIFMRWRCTR